MTLAQAILIVLLSLGYLVWHFCRSRSSAVDTRPAELPPIPSPPGAGRLTDHERALRFVCEPCQRYAYIKDLYERGELTDAEAIYLLEVD